MIQVGLDRLLDSAEVLQGRRYGVVAHSASVSSDMVPIQLALARADAPLPVKMFGPEHGFFGVEQDMVPSGDSSDPWIGVPIVSLYGESEDSLRPDGSAFSGLDMILVDLQDVGARYYTYAATAIWSASAALAEGCEVWVLDRPNPLGGEQVEGNVRQQGFESFVGAFETPVRHGLTLAEIMRWQLSREGADTSGLKVWRMGGWRREMSWRSTGRRWVAPSPNLPSPRIARVYPGACLIEATSVSEGRGTTRPFELIGSPTVQPVDLADRLNAAGLRGARFVPTYFRPQFHKHAGEVCGGVQWIVEDSATLEPYRCGIEIVRALMKTDPDFSWRAEPYEFVQDIPAIDLLVGTDVLRRALEEEADLDEWLATWREDERRFRAETLPFRLYESESDRSGDL